MRQVPQARAAMPVLHVVERSCFASLAVYSTRGESSLRRHKDMLVVLLFVFLIAWPLGAFLF